jgi:hypothetical protein
MVPDLYVAFVARLVDNATIFRGDTGFDFKCTLDIVFGSSRQEQSECSVKHEDYSINGYSFQEKLQHIAQNP